MIWLVLAAAVVTWGLTGVYIRAMIARGRLDVPNDRSMHALPKPSGAGIVVVPVILALWCLSTPSAGDLNRVLVPCALGLAVIGFIDDMFKLRARVRLCAQVAAIGIYLALLPRNAQILPFLPVLLERLVLALAFTWFVNLFNFMDGIDGIAGGEAASIGLGFVVVAGFAAPGSALASIIAAAMAGYLVWNWAPGRVMMGDAGSIPLGFLTGALLIELALAGYLAAAIILPLFFCLDATVTLVRRFLAGHRFYDAHRQHLYQRAALGCASHATVVSGMLLANLGLIAAAVLARNHAAWGLVFAGLILTAFVGWLSQLAANKASA